MFDAMKERLTLIVWHHSGPYDAAAPSRNQNQPQAKAPMRAFNAQQAAQAAAQAQAQAQAQNQPANGSPTRTGPSVSLATPPVPPAKDINEGSTRRAQAAIDRKPTSNPRRTSGGLTGQYSTSMPTSGGYFPDMAAEPTDEAEIARRERQRQREEKRRALKAAWGIDNREPRLIPFASGTDNSRAVRGLRRIPRRRREPRP